MFQYLQIDSDMLDANANYSVSTYLTDFNCRDVNIYTHILSFFPNSTFLAVHLKWTYVDCLHIWRW